jgi:hypothetical protein
MWFRFEAAKMQRSQNRLDRQQREAARRSAAAFREAARCVARERKARQKAGGPPDIKYVEIFPEIADLEYIDPASEVVSRAIDLIRPLNLSEPDFREEITLFMLVVRILQFGNTSPPLRPIKDQIKEVADALKIARRAIRTLPRIARITQSVFWDDFCDLIDEAIQMAEERHKGIEVGDGGRNLDLAKDYAANAAHHVISEWKRTKPVKTVNGAFYELASVIYEGGTGIEGANLQRHCRRAVDDPRPNLETIDLELFFRSSS